MIIFVALAIFNLVGLWFITGYLKPTFFVGLIYFLLILICPPLAIAIYMTCRPQCKVTRFMREDIRSCTDILNRGDPMLFSSYLSNLNVTNSACQIFVILYSLFGGYFYFMLAVPFLGSLYGGLSVMFALLGVTFLGSF